MNIIFVFSMFITKWADEHDRPANLIISGQSKILRSRLSEWKDPAFLSMLGDDIDQAWSKTEMGLFMGSAQFMG